MAGEDNAKHVKRLALQPIRRGPNASDARNFFAIAGVSLHAQTLVLCKGIKVEHHVEALLALRPVHRRQVGEQVEFFFIAQIERNLRQPPAFHRQDRLFAVLNGFHQRTAELRAHAPNQFIVQRRLQLHRRLRWRRRGRLRRRSARWRSHCGFGRRSGRGCRTARGLVARGHAGRLLFLGFVGHRPCAMRARSPS